MIDSREVGPGDLFVGLPGERVDGGAFARAALEAGAWGVLVAPEGRADGSWPRRRGAGQRDAAPGAERLARAWRRDLART